MPIMLEKTYRALRAAQVPEDLAGEAAAELAGYENRLAALDARLGALEGRLTMLQWMVGLNLALTAGILLKLLAG